MTKDKLISLVIVQIVPLRDLSSATSIIVQIGLGKMNMHELGNLYDYLQKRSKK